MAIPLIVYSLVLTVAFSLGYVTPVLAKGLLKEDERWRELEVSRSGLPFITDKEASLLGRDQEVDLETCLRFALERQGEIRAAEQGIDAAFWKAQEAHRQGVPAGKYQYPLAPAPPNVH